ncbi:MAG: NifB/NifX family molybdenum-iron cluster-binding protein [Shewanella sp.]|uniref:NifB/NifX family molybdenum-iron cluster-binding protein n=1 Tax=Shewanella sp. TaxID=50422 RepID=UPI003C781D1C
MITAIPIKDDHIANHFSRADSMIIINENAEVIASFANPALTEGCDGKKQLLSLIVAHGAERVIVRNIGQQLLSKMLNHQLKVFHVKNGRTAINDLAHDHLPQCEQFSDAIQGRPSIKHLAKQANGGCCGHEHGDGGCQGGHCGGHDHDASEMEVAEGMHFKRCCQKKHSFLGHNE